MHQPVKYENRRAHFYALLKQSLKGIEHDYTQGSIKSAIVLLAIPMILELSLESVFAVVDMFFVGKLGAKAIATVALTELCMTLIYSIAMGLGIGATAVVSRRVGEGDPDGATHAGMQSLLIAGIIAVIITVCGVIYAPDILKVLGAAEEVVKEGAKFTRIMMSSSLFIILLFLINGIFRGAGDAAMAMKSLWIASLTNIVPCLSMVTVHSPSLVSPAQLLPLLLGGLWACATSVIICLKVRVP